MGTIKTFGPVDGRSLAQLERCMEAGDADFGVLCAEAPEVYKRLPDVLDRTRGRSG